MGLFGDLQTNVAQGDPGLPGDPIRGKLDQWGRSPDDPAYGDPAPPGNATVSAPWDQGGDSRRGVDQTLIDPRYLTDPAIAAARARDGLTSDPAAQQAVINSTPVVKLGGGNPLNAVYGNGPSFQEGTQRYIESGGKPNDATAAIAAGVDPKVATAPGYTYVPSPAIDTNFYPGANGTGGGGAAFYQQMAAQAANTPAPQLQRTSVDWSGTGSGQGAAPNNALPPVPAPPTGLMSAAPPGGPGPQTMADAQRALYNPPAPSGGVRAGAASGAAVAPQMGAAPPPPAADTRGLFGVMPTGTPSGGVTAGASSGMTSRMGDVTLPPGGPGGGGGGGGGSAQPPAGGGLMSMDQQAMGQVPTPVGNYGGVITQRSAPVTVGGKAAPTTVQGYAPSPPPPPAPAAPQPGIPATGQFANPLFQKSQQARGEQSAIEARSADPNLYNGADKSAADASRGQQQGLISLLNRDINGGAPSLAEAQLKRGTDATVATANALAASAGPGNANAAARQATQTAATAGQDLAGRTAELRAQEYAQARGELGTATTAARGADISTFGQTSANTTAQATLLANQARDKRAADLQATGMSYDAAFKQAQLEADQNKTQLATEMGQRALNQTGQLGLLGLGQGDSAQEQEAREHAADLLVQKYGIDKGVAVAMIGQSPINQVLKGAATGGAVAGVPGALVGGGIGYLNSRLS